LAQDVQVRRVPVALLQVEAAKASLAMPTTEDVPAFAGASV
jgi:hypothetical protein